VVLGVLTFLRRFGWLRWLNLGYLWPLLVIGVGVWMLVRYFKEK